MLPPLVFTITANSKLKMNSFNGTVRCAAGGNLFLVCGWEHKRFAETLEAASVGAERSFTKKAYLPFSLCLLRLDTRPVGVEEGRQTCVAAFFLRHPKRHFHLLQLLTNIVSVARWAHRHCKKGEKGVF